jgi:hypothetical protein
MKILSLLTSALVLAATLPGNLVRAEEKTTVRTTIKSLGLTMDVPKGWTASPNAGSGRSPTFKPPSDSGSVGRFYILEKSSYSDLESFRDVEIAATRHVMPTTVVVQSSNLTLESGAEARKVVTEPNFKDVDLVVTLYFISGAGSKKFIIHATGTKENFSTLGPLYDSWVKSIKVIPIPPGEPAQE